MPDPYENPPDKPPVAPYTWVPSQTPTGGDTPFGFNSLTLERGQFRNDLPIDERWSGSVKIITSGDLLSESGSENYPILRAFRSLSRPSIPVGPRPTEPCVVRGEEARYEVLLQDASIPNSANVRISAITLEYALTVDLQDALLPRFLTAEDAAKLEAYRASPTSERPDIAWENYVFGRIVATPTSGEEQEYPARGEANEPVELKLTDVTPHPGNAPTRTLTVKFGAGFLPENYPFLKSVRIENRYQLPTLRLEVHRVLLFNAARVNIAEENLPCALLQYAYPVRFEFDFQRDQAIWPNNQTTPNFHVKLFQPEDVSGTQGMAHSIALRFLIFAMPVYGLAPQDYSSLVGALSGLANPGAYMAVFVGPTAGKRSLQFALVNRWMQPPALRAVPLDHHAIPPNIARLILQTAVGQEGDGVPGEGAEWETLLEYVPASPPQFNAATGPVAAPYLALHAGKEKAWYRVLQNLTNGGQAITPAYRSQPYTERGALALAEASVPGVNTSGEVARRVPLVTTLPQQQPLNAPLLALWVADTSDPLASPVSFGRGPWKWRFRAACDDPNGYTETYLYARFWFVPETEILNFDNLETHRSVSEFIFVTQDTGTRLSRQTATSLSQLLVSPPLSSAMTPYELVRYADALAEGNGKDWTLPFGSNIRARLVVGVYAVSYLTEAGRAAGLTTTSASLPKVRLELDGQYASLETTLQQTLSGRIFAQRAGIYDASNYAKMAAPLTLTRRKSGGGVLGSDPEVYEKYEGRYRASHPDAPSVMTARKGLLLLEPEAAPSKIALPITEVAPTEENQVGFYADFCTEGATLSGGRVEAGVWQAHLTLHRHSLDTARMGVNFRLEAFLATSDGSVVFRVFRTPVVSGPELTGSATITFEQTLQVPFTITGTDVQLVLRLHYYPFVREGEAVDIPLLTKQLTEAGLPFGVRIDSLTLVDHTLHRLQVAQTDSRLGSPAFYEAMPLVPSQAIGAQDFYYVAAPDNLKIVIFPSDKTWPISGCLYSPAWFLSLPRGMEARLGAAGLGENNLYYRTVLADSRIATQQAVTAVEEPVSQTLHVAHDVPEDSVSAQEFSALSRTGTKIRHLTFQLPYGPPHTSQDIQGLKTLQSVTLEGKYPNLHLLHPAPGRSRQGILAVAAQVEENEASAITSALNLRAGAAAQWIGPNQSLTGGASFGDIRRMAQYLQFPAIATGNNGVLSYIAGWASPGAILVKETSPYEARDTGVAEGNLYLVESDDSELAIGEQKIILPQGSLLGRAVQTFPGILVDSIGQITVAYAIEGDEGVIYARTSQSGNVFSPARPLVSLRAAGVGNSVALRCFGIALAHYAPTRTSYGAFWCAGKIWVAPLQTQGRIIFPKIQLVAGRGDFQEGGNEAHPLLAALQAAHALDVHQEGEGEEDVPRQRPGFLVSHKPPYQGRLFVYYRDARGTLKLRTVEAGGRTFAPVTLNS